MRRILLGALNEMLRSEFHDLIPAIVRTKGGERECFSLIEGHWSAICLEPCDEEQSMTIGEFAADWEDFGFRDRLVCITDSQSQQQDLEWLMENDLSETIFSITITEDGFYLLEAC